MSSHKRKIGRRSLSQSYRPFAEELESRLTPSAGGIATTNFHVFARPLAQGSSPSGDTPLQILEAYGFDTSSGTNAISFNGVAGNGANQTIAIVDAYNDPNIASDLSKFDAQFNLPAPASFSVVNQNGQTTSLPGADRTGGWEMEEALDVEWAHALAPGASIVLVEASSASDTNLFTAVTTAAKMSGVSVVSMSWSGGEFSGETGDDSIFTTPSGHQGVTFLAATGDNGSPSGYPAYSPNVVAVGGTTLTITTSTTNGVTSYSYAGESAWSGSGGGVSADEAEPAYQDAVQSTGKRTVPDVAFDANPNTGVAIYDSYDNPSGPWTQVGGTSVATPCWGAIVSIINQGRVAGGGSTLNGVTQTLPALYSLSSSDFHDNLAGSNGASTNGLVNPAIYNEVTGLGSPVVNSLVPDMVAYGNANAPHLVITTEPANTTAGASFGFTATVEISGGADLGFTGNVTVSLLSNPGGTTLGGTLTVPVLNGVATFSGLSLNKAGAGYTLSVSASGLSNVATSAFNVTPGSAAQIVATTQPPANVTQNAAFSVAFAIEDAYGNVLTGDNSDSVSVSFANNAGPTGTVLGGAATPVTVVDGVATFTGLTVNNPGTGFTLQAQFTLGQTTAITSLATSPFAVIVPTQATQLVFTTEPPSSVRVNTAFIVNVSVENAAGQVVTNFTGTVTIAIAGNPAGGSVTMSVVDGVATFDLELSGTGALSLEATSTGLTSAISTPITLRRR